MGRREMSEDCFKKTESYLYKYAFWKAEVTAWFMQYTAEHGDMFPSATSAVWGGVFVTGSGAYTSSTERYGILRGDVLSAMPNDISNKHQRVCLVHAALEALTDEEREIFEQKYVKQRRDIDVWMDMDKGKTWFYERRRSLVEKVARVLGFL